MACEADPLLWLKTYLRHKFYLDFTPNQEEITAEVVHRARHGGDKAIAAPRGDGKTSLVEGVIGGYCMVTGTLRFPVILSATGTDAENILANIKGEFETNDLLLEDYPEICVPIRELKGAPQAAGTQTVDGERTLLKWSGSLIQLPTVTLRWCPLCYGESRERGKKLVCKACGHEFQPYKSKSAGAAFTARGVDGSIRGLRRGSDRPDFVLLDDIETEDVAASLHQIAKMERKIENAVGGLAGPDKRLARVMLVTIQNPQCLAARYTSPQVKPGFSGVRYRQVMRWPDRKDLWERYIEIRQDGKRSREDLDGRAATAFYLERQEVMDAGAIVANPHRFVSAPGEDGEPLEHSAIQHVHNEAADKGWDFVFCEYQNDPPEPADMSGLPRVEDLIKRVNGHGAWEVPADTTVVTAQIDCGQEVLWWMVCGWTGRFGGYVLAYGAFPDQRRTYYTSAEIGPTLEEWYKDTKLGGPGKVGDVDEWLYAGLEALSDKLFRQQFSSRSGVAHSIARLGVDAGWKSEVVHRFCRQNQRSGLILPTKGEGISAKQCPMLQRPLKHGERRGNGWPWRWVYPQGKQHRLLEVDANFAKEFVHDRLAVGLGAEAPITIYGDARQRHDMLANHLLSERRTLVEANGRKKYEYEPKSGEDNHWLDALVGCAALASFEGITVSGQVVDVKKELSLAALQAARKARR